MSDTRILNSKPKEKPFELADIDGLHHLINPSGSRLRRLKYRIHGKEKLLSLGAYPAGGLADARRLKGLRELRLSLVMIPALRRMKRIVRIANGVASHWPPKLIRPTVTPRAAITDPKALGELLRARDVFHGQVPNRIALQSIPLLVQRPGELRHAQ